MEQPEKAIFMFFTGNTLFRKLSKNQNCQFKLKFGTKTNSNIHNSMLLLRFSIFGQKYRFWSNLVQKIRIVTLISILVPKLIWVCRIQWCCSLFLFSTEPFLGRFDPKNQNCQLSWNLVSRLIRICRIQWWYSIFLLSTRSNFLGQIWSKKSKLSV